MRLLLVPLLAPLFFLGSCDSATCSDYATCGAAGPSDAGGDATVVAPPGCDLTKAPKDSPACIDDSVGLFVDGTSGADANPGTKAAPKKSVGAAVAAVGGKPRVYVCQGTYAESVAIKASVSLYGGLSCGAFAYTGAQPTIQPTAGTDYALDISASNVTVTDLALVGPELGAPNSIAVRVVGSTGVTFVGSRLEGRTGAKGADGTTTNFTGFPGQTDLNGNSASGTKGGDAKPITCPGGGGTSTGGKGGDNGFSGDPGMPALSGGAAGSLGQSCAAGGTGGDGSAGSTKNGDGAKSVGALTQNVWTPEVGSAGPVGGPGQGGGGGQGSGGGGGGSGGAGGCGGAGGGGGNGGGGSVALLSLNSTTTVLASTLSVARGGDGGNGAAGQGGQPLFGIGGVRTGTGCLGGNGGPGGNGGAGGGGAGGISVGFVFKGTKPSLDADVKVTPGTAGKKGAGGVIGTNDGVDGVAQDSLEAP